MEKVTIMDVAAEGKAIAKVNDLVIFVPYVVPGDVVDLQIKRKKNKYAEAEAVKFHELSPNRAVPFCQHYGVCGGCKWQVLPYSEQIRYKQKQVEDNLRRIGKIELPEISPILGSDKTEFYRNKLEFTFSDRRWLTPEEIAYFHTSDERVSVATLDGRTLPVDRSLDTLMGQLPAADFYRANRQFIVSRRAIADLSVWFGSRLTLNLCVKTPERIVISKARVPEFKRWFLEGV